MMTRSIGSNSQGIDAEDVDTSIADARQQGMGPTPTDERSASLAQTIVLLALSRGERPPVFLPRVRDALLRRRWIAPVPDRKSYPITELGRAALAGSPHRAQAERAIERERGAAGRAVGVGQHAISEETTEETTHPMNDANSAPPGRAAPGIAFDRAMAAVDLRCNHLTILLNGGNVERIEQVLRSAVNLWLTGRSALRRLVECSRAQGPQVTAAHQRLDSSYLLLLRILGCAQTEASDLSTRSQLEDMRVDLVAAAAKPIGDERPSSSSPAIAPRFVDKAGPGRDGPARAAMRGSLPATELATTALSIGSDDEEAAHVTGFGNRQRF